MKLSKLVEGIQIIREESEGDWIKDPHGFYTDTDEVVKVDRLADTTPDRLHKDPVAVSGGKEIYIPTRVSEYDARTMKKIFNGLKKIIKSKGSFIAGVRKGLRVGNTAIPFGTASDEDKAKHGKSSEVFGIRLLVTVDGLPLSRIAQLMGTEEVLGPRPGEEKPFADTGSDEERPEGDFEVPEYVQMLWDTLDRLQADGTIHMEKAAAPMFGGSYAAIYSKANPNRVMLFHRAVGKGFYIIPDKIAMYVYPDKPEMMPWKQALAAFKANPAKYLGNLIKPGGLLHRAKDAHPQLYNQVAEIVDTMGSEDVEHPLAKRPRHLFRFYLLGSGQFAGEYESGEGRAFSRKDREKLANDIAAWAAGGKAAESLEYLNQKLIESICDRHEYVILEDKMIGETSVYDFNAPHERLYGDLNPDEQAQLKAIRSPNDIKSVDVIDDWMDDHIMCVGVKLNGIPIGFWWVGSDIGAFEYSDSPRAKAKIFEMLRREIEDTEAEFPELKGGQPVGEDKKGKQAQEAILRRSQDMGLRSYQDIPERDWLPRGIERPDEDEEYQGILSGGPDKLTALEMISKFAKQAFEYRKAGAIDRAMDYEAKVTELIHQAHEYGYGDEAEAAEHEAQLP